MPKTVETTGISPGQALRLKKLYIEGVYEAALSRGQPAVPSPGSEICVLVGQNWIRIAYDWDQIERIKAECGENIARIIKSLRRISGIAVKNCGRCGEGLPIIMIDSMEESGHTERRWLALCPMCAHICNARPSRKR